VKRLSLSVGLATVAVLLSACFPGRAQQTPARPFSALSSATTYHISGKVVDSRTGAALARCSLQVADVKERGQPRTTTSGDDGSFGFDGLARGKYSLTAERHGYLTQAFEEHDQFSTAIAVGPGLVSEGLVFHLTPEAVLTGTITDEAGEPVRGAQVRLYEDQDQDGVRSTQQRQNVMSDDRGVYEVSELRPGAYFLVVTAHPWYAQGRQPQSADFSGQNSEDNGLQTLDVAYPTTFYPGVSDQDAATPIPVKGGERLEANITLAAQPALRLRLPAPPAGQGHRQGGASVMLTQTIFGQVENVPIQEDFGTDGSIVLDGVLPGHYDVTLSRYGEGLSKAESKHFDAEVTGGSTELTGENGIDEITVTGKVAAVSGKLPQGAAIMLRTPHRRRQEYTAVNEKGEFELTVLPGTYEVVGGINEMYIASIKASGAALTGRTLTVKPGDSPKLEIVAGTGHGEIEGTALRDGKPISGVMVLLAPEDPKNNEILFRRDQSDSDGTFTLPNVIPGRYRLLAIEKGWELEWANPAVLQAFLAKSVPLEVKSGDHLNQSVDAQSR
jgi:hypothetical protein